MRTRLNPANWADLIAAVLDGRVKRGKQRRRNDPWDFSLDAETAWSFVEALPLRPVPLGIWVTKNEAVSLIGTTPSSFGFLTPNGLIRRNGNTKMHTYFCLSSIEEFNSKYFVNSQSKRLFGLGTISFRNAMKKCGFRPVAMCPHFRLWHRRDVDSAFSMFK